MVLPVQVFMGLLCVWMWPEAVDLKPLKMKKQAVLTPTRVTAFWAAVLTQLYS